MKGLSDPDHIELELCAVSTCASRGLPANRRCEGKRRPGGIIGFVDVACSSNEEGPAAVTFSPVLIFFGGRIPGISFVGSMLKEKQEVSV